MRNEVRLSVLALVLAFAIGCGSAPEQPAPAAGNAPAETPTAGAPVTPGATASTPGAATASRSGIRPLAPSIRFSIGLPKPLSNSESEPHAPGDGWDVADGAARASTGGAADFAGCGRTTWAACASRFSPWANIARPVVSAKVTIAKWRYMLGGMAGVTARRMTHTLTGGS